jgi:F0F1-type ATP synthase gamma subunit
MTTPIERFEPIEPLAKPSYFRLRISDEKGDLDAVREAGDKAVAAGLLGYSAIEARRNNQTGSLAHMVKVTDTNGTDYFGDTGDSVVLTYHGDELAGYTIYNGPDGSRTTNRKLAELFPADEPATEPEPEPQPELDLEVEPEPEPVVEPVVRTRA